jgi:hypothetical protein
MRSETRKSYSQATPVTARLEHSRTRSGRARLLRRRRGSSDAIFERAGRRTLRETAQLTTAQNDLESEAEPFDNKHLVL